MQSYSRLQCSPVLVRQQASNIDKFHLAGLPQQNSKTTNTLEHSQYRRGRGKRKTKLKC